MDTGIVGNPGMNCFVGFPACVLFVYSSRPNYNIIVDVQSPLIQEEVTISLADLARKVVGRENEAIPLVGTDPFPSQ